MKTSPEKFATFGTVATALAEGELTVADLRQQGEQPKTDTLKDQLKRSAQ